MEEVTASLRAKLAFERSRVIRDSASSKSEVRRHRFGKPLRVTDEVSYKTRLGAEVQRVVLAEDERIRKIREKFAASREALYSRLAARMDDDCGCEGQS